jgi:retinol dehydrogenase-14
MKRNNMKPMAGRTMAVTGATGGIGKATAHGLAQMGAHLVIIGCDPQRTEETAEAMRSAGGGKVGACCRPVLPQVRRLADELLTLPRIDVLINNAGG